MTRPPQNVFTLALTLGLALLCGLGLGLLVYSSPAAIAATAADTPAVPVAALAEAITPGRPAVTVWVEPNVTRQRGGAEALCEMHVKMAREGWSIVDVEVYNEDGNMKGFFATYTK